MLANLQTFFSLIIIQYSVFKKAAIVNLKLIKPSEKVIFSSNKTNFKEFSFYISAFSAYLILAHGFEYFFAPDFNLGRNWIE